MRAPLSAKRIPFNLDLVLGRGLGRTLLLSFFALAMIPMLLVGAFSDHMAGTHLAQEVRRDIGIIAELKRRQLQAFFDEGSTDADRQGLQPATPAFFNTIDRMLEMPMDDGAGSRVYLVDAQGRWQAGTSGEPEFSRNATVDTDQTRRWREGLSVPPAPFAYAGPGGHPVIGTFAEVRLGETPYALIVEVDRQAAFGARNRFRAMVATLLILTGVGALVVAAGLARSIVGPVRDLSRTALMVAAGRLDHGLDVTAKNEIGELAAACDNMIRHLRAARAENDTRARLMSGLASLHQSISGEHDSGELCLKTLEFLFGFLDLSQADFFFINDKGTLACICRLPGHAEDETHQTFYPQDGGRDQTASEGTIVTLRKDPETGQATPAPATDTARLIAVPLVLQGTVKGVLELEKTEGFHRWEYRFLETAADVIAVALNAALIGQQEAALLERTRKQAEKLQVREAALEEKTGELKDQRRAFRTSEHKLQLKQLELEAANAQMVKNASDLEAHMAILEKQKRDMENQNTELEKAHRELEDKARQLEATSRYKTEFMANMSHELRTPLNSILLLSRLLMENKENTLTVKQSQFAQTIHSAGDDLLNLINEILDLAKVESGKMEVVHRAVRIQSIVHAMQVSFSPLAEQSGVAFTTHVAPDVPGQVFTDRKRIEQIIKNFLSNAFKFTPTGTIRLEIAVDPDVSVCRNPGDRPISKCLDISVVDTGIGIPAAKHRMVFEAFQQVDGSTRRKYGGTGLGLSISRELARLLGGEITLESEAGQGSRFTLHLPLNDQIDETPAVVPTETKRQAPRPPIEGGSRSDRVEASAAPEPVPDDRRRLSPGDESILIIDATSGTTEPIKAFAHRNDYPVLVAEQVQTGLHFADYYLPSAIFASLQLPGARGWALIRRLKANPRTWHTPVFTLSPREDGLAAAFHGAAGHVIEPVTVSSLQAAFHRIERLRSMKDRTVLALAPAPDHFARITEAVGVAPIRIIPATTAAECQAALGVHSVQAVIVHAAMEPTEPQRFLTGMRNHPTPVILFSDGPPPPFCRTAAGQYAGQVNLETVETPDQLLLALVLRLHLPPEALNRPHRDRLQALDRRRPAFEGRQVLLVDDDMRTVFAVSNVLEDQGATVVTGKTGKESLDKLDGFPDIDLILMDVMIAEVDGYRAIREIRNRKRFRTLPIIALTAKAMKGDRSKCIAAGADDYLAKPVNLDKLTSMLRIWLDPQ
ncbi:hypothetical protein DSCA_32630 [Desulfosarcina alkanivorans]|uniref:histidine kinase n=1 Tax=Desulfosarcina alkanivorans TaxID=571177 RepID=A0A5K7YLE6_9BACT|nr:response regulator [Desulfosarcina alkanivorans]BBO69333.1 hypothetical protein DSCA_32630 [Desulfosarcina alkanivorans]